MAWKQKYGIATTHGFVKKEDFERDQIFEGGPLFRAGTDTLTQVHIKAQNKQTPNKNRLVIPTEDGITTEWCDSYERTTNWVNANCSGRVFWNKKSCKMEFELEKDLKKYEDDLNKEECWEKLSK